MKIPRAVLEAMIGHARRGHPHEVCGVLVGAGTPEPPVVSYAEAVPNHETESPRVRYQIAPEDLIRIQREARADGLDIVGYYHSHPDHPARPSETDRRVAAEGLSDGVRHVVIGVDALGKAEPTAWTFRDATQSFEPETLDLT